MLTNKFKPTVAELREIYTELVSPTISDWSEGWEQVSKAIGHCGMYQEKAAMESFDEITREVVKRLGFQNICLSENIVADRARFAEIYQAIKKHVPEFQMIYDVDPLKQRIADSWPDSLDDTCAREEWGWKPAYNLESMTVDMLEKLREKLK